MKSIIFITLFIFISLIISVNCCLPSGLNENDDGKCKGNEENSDDSTFENKNSDDIDTATSESDSDDDEVSSSEKGNNENIDSMNESRNNDSNDSKSEIGNGSQDSSSENFSNRDETDSLQENSTTGEGNDDSFNEDKKSNDSVSILKTDSTTENDKGEATDFLSENGTPDTTSESTNKGSDINETVTIDKNANGNQDSTTENNIHDGIGFTLKSNESKAASNLSDYVLPFVQNASSQSFRVNIQGIYTNDLASIFERTMKKLRKRFDTILNDEHVSTTDSKIIQTALEKIDYIMYNNTITSENGLRDMLKDIVEQLMIITRTDYNLLLNEHTNDIVRNKLLKIFDSSSSTAKVLSDFIELLSDE